MIIRIKHQILAELPMPELRNIDMMDESDIVFETITFYHHDYLNGIVSDTIKESLR